MASNLFMGTSILALDAKGRLQVPARHREELLNDHGGKLVLTRHPDGYLMLLPQTTWAQTAERLAQLGGNDGWFRRIVLGGAVRVELDSSLRIQIPQELRIAAGFDEAHKEAHFVGNGSLFEIWEATRIQADEAQGRAQPRSDAIRNFVF